MSNTISQDIFNDYMKTYYKGQDVIDSTDTLLEKILDPEK